jgi:hypothetical protein
MRSSIPVTGQQIGAWVVAPDPVRIAVTCAHCGAARRMPLADFQRGQKSCRKCGEGGTRVDRGGRSAHPLYKTWVSMKHRCGPTAGARTRARYMDRGIAVCPEWAGPDGYEPFRAWALANGWVPKLHLDRRDNDRGYSPGNCRWVPRVINVENREVTRFVTAWGEQKSLAAWISDPRCVVDYDVASDRLYRGRGNWTPERALSTPRRVRKDNRAEPRFVPGQRG